MFWNKKINITAYTDNHVYYKNTPPTFNKLQVPDYLKNLKSKKTLDPASGIEVPYPTIKTCPGIRDFLSTGIQICAWEDIILQIRPDGTFTYASPAASQARGANGHHWGQWGDLYPKNRISVKLNSPWYIKADRSARFLMMESHYSTSLFRDYNVWVPPGILDFYYQRSTNIHLIFPINDIPYDVYIKSGDPLVTLFPLTDKAINFDVQSVSPDEYNKLTELPYSFVNRYSKFYKSNKHD